ncbi:unnamed protein product, partial [Polarella glacialis]
VEAMLMQEEKAAESKGMEEFGSFREGLGRNIRCGLMICSLYSFKQAGLLRLLLLLLLSLLWLLMLLLFILDRVERLFFS